MHDVFLYRRDGGMIGIPKSNVFIVDSALLLELVTEENDKTNICFANVFDKAFAVECTLSLS